jgi:hypothetical protein
MQVVSLDVISHSSQIRVISSERTKALLADRCRAGSPIRQFRHVTPRLRLALHHQRLPVAVGDSLALASGERLSSAAHHYFVDERHYPCEERPFAAALFGLLHFLGLALQELKSRCCELNSAMARFQQFRQCDLLRRFSARSHRHPGRYPPTQQQTHLTAC